MSIPREELYTYRVEWSEEDQEFVGIVAEFPSLSCLADSSLDALSGIQQVVLQAIDILEEEGKPVPEPYRLRQEPPMRTRGADHSFTQAGCLVLGGYTRQRSCARLSEGPR